MEQRISLVTLGVTDLARARSFYEALGWVGQTVQDTVFYQVGGLAVVLWSREKLAADCGLDDHGPAGFGGIALAQNLRSPEEVDALMAVAERAGATVTRPAATTFYGGYAGVFTDPDGHAWEIAHNPGFPLAADGSLTLPDFDSL
ncbi:VOC family protein [Streptomyces sp. NBC_00247]|uniref:VOC family protein n=1 Tax=Streptomyces sp. NBC_00247 TaxID=2975689 RepID=UPI002E28A1C2|nr:VOC family protein [Streptomyces sp. NBC_00247]